MHRERDSPPWEAFAKEHADAIAEMRTVLRTRREVANRDFAMHERRRVDHYRGRKDSASPSTTCGASARRWSAAESVSSGSTLVPIASHRGRLIRESDAALADDAILRKQVAFEGLTRFSASAASFGARSRRPSWWPGATAAWPTATCSRCG